LQILTHLVQFFDTLNIHTSEMIKKLLKTLIQPKIGTYTDTKLWIQKILLDAKYGKIKF